MDKRQQRFEKSSFTKFLFLLILILSLLTSCKSNKKERLEIPFSKYVTAQAETKSVPRDSISDSADDPAIWVNRSQPDSSYIIGTDKQGGLAVYNLSGHELFYYQTGRMNNVDIRYDFVLDSDTIDILAVSNRTGQTIDLYKINSNGALEVIHRNQLISKIKDEVYGLCMYKSRDSGKFYVFVNGKDGTVEQWELFPDNNKINGKIVRNLKLDSQVEGMVTDDDKGLLYVGEEDKGIWRFQAEPSVSDLKEFLQFSSEKENPFIQFDIEGLAIYDLPDQHGYLIASSQGNDSYAVFERNPPNNYIGSFKIVDGNLIDGSQGTDGIEVTSASLGTDYPYGLLIVQDGVNKENGTSGPHNFKIIRWDSIANKFNPSLKY